MRYRILGSTGLRVSELFLGAMTFGESDGGGVPAAECARILDVYSQAGGNVIDTAVFYRNGASETVLGQLLQGRRDSFVISTKYTPTIDADDPNGGGSHRKNLIRSLDTSLRRLRTDYIDLYWVALWDRYTPVEETMRALDVAVRAGKVLHVGFANTPAWLVSHARATALAHDWTPPCAIQVPYSLLKRDIERELLPMADTLGLSVAGWGPIGHGVLSAKFTRPGGPQGETRVAPGSLSERDHTVSQLVAEIADDLGATPAQVAIAWILTRSRLIHPILGARNAEQLSENIGALDVVLPDEAVKRLTEATDVPLGYPGDFIEQAAGWVFGNAGGRLDSR